MGELMIEDWRHWGELRISGSIRIREIASEGCYIFMQRKSFLRVLSNRKK